MVNNKPKKTRNQSGAIIGSNDDLLMQIVLRLPVPSVLRFKSVNKQWCSLLSNPPFTLLYKNASVSRGIFTRNSYIPFDENRSNPPFLDLDFYPDPCGIRIVQSCNGLLLCSSRRGDKSVRKYYVFNPTTKQFTVIPSVLGGIDVRRNIYFMGLAFHQTDCVHYNLVCFHRDKPWFKRTKRGDVFKIQIYSSETGKWKNSDALFSLCCHSSAYFNSIVYWNQAIYWAPCCDKSLYFNLETDKLQPLPLPIYSEYYKDGEYPLYFGESRGHLHWVEPADPSVCFLHLNVFEMLTDNSGWFLMYRVELDELVNAYPKVIDSNLESWSPYYNDFEVLDVVRGEEEDETFLVIRIPGKVIRYNVVEKSFKQISDRNYRYTGEVNVHRFIESVVSF